MTGQEFRRIALAQGLLPAAPMPVLEQPGELALDDQPRPHGPADNPAMAEQQVTNA